MNAVPRDARLVLAAQALRAFAYGFGAVLIGATLRDRHFTSTEVGVVLTAVVAGTALMSVVVEPARPGDEMVVITIWPSHEVFDAWIATPERDALTASDVHRAVNYRPLVRRDVAGGYLSLAGLTGHDPSPPIESEDRP